MDFIYRFFSSFYGTDLDDHLCGYNCVTSVFDKQNMCPMIGAITIGVAAVLVVFYYYILNNPRFCRWWHWLITMGISSVLSLFIGYGICNHQLQNGYIGQCLNVTGANCWGFGFANFIVSAMFFFVISIGIKWWSTNCRRTPF